ncbi:hypothetical protein BDW59DRAFT_147468 [Aspergillus cavernicola]|uniref:Suppressor protein SRP40 n=1 Tax=Aspergillus cavernicola TaxID=176166 RepID=A0ABR4I9U9_9EURO
MTSPSTRLHIAPFNPDLLPLVLPASIRSLATGISYHCIPTFPENNYGYVTLPAIEADKIKKKLNGSILKGRKFKVDSAHPHKRQRDEDGKNNTSSDKAPSNKKSKKRQAGDSVLEGYELPSDRKVKRGWTESENDKTERRKKEKKSKSKEEKEAKLQLKSKHTEKAECLFRTKVPPNRSSLEDEKLKKQAKKKSKSSHESVVHEFANTMTQPTFLRSEDGGKSLISTFEESKGWVDETGNVKESTSDRIRKDQYRPGQVAGHKEKPKQVKPKSPTKAEKPSKNKPKGTTTKLKEAEAEAESTESEDWTSSSGSSSEEEDATDSESDESVSSSSSEGSEKSADSFQKEQQHLSTPNFSREEKQKPSTDIKVLPREGSTEATSQQQLTEVHPLEALFKRPVANKKTDSDTPAQFSFFGQEDAESEEETSRDLEPLTPFAKGDMQDRGFRSAAPTPDTSHVARTINWNPPEHGEEPSLYTDSPVSKPSIGSKEDSDFSKWFWENRGDNNRAWKKRRRDAAKEQRQRENRRKGMKGKS